MSASSQVLVYLSGANMDSVAGTDINLVTALAARSLPILWVDPVVSVVGQYRRRGDTAGSSDLTWISPMLSRLRVVGAPGVTRPIMRTFARRSLEHAIVTSLRKLDVTSSAVVLSNPIGRFPDAVAGRRLYYVTDDWVSGAPMMGLSRKAVQHCMARNIRRADVIAAVSQTLGTSISRQSDPPLDVEVIPNGCTVPVSVGTMPTDLPAGPLVALTGQLNERLDYDMLDAVAGTGLRIVVIGPRTERTSETTRRLDDFLALPNVYWLGSRPSSSIADYLRMMSVGITPYLLNTFNMASFPLKTLEYLASGLAVVTTELPAARQLACEHVRVAESAAAFARYVVELVAAESDSIAHLERRTLASQHSWDARASAVLELLHPGADDQVDESISDVGGR